MKNFSTVIDFNPRYYYDAYFTKKNLLTHFFYRKKMDELLSTIQKYKKPPSTILDCACASGLLSYLFYKRNYCVSAFDILEEFVVFAKQKMPKAYIFQSDIKTFTSPLSYDVIICADIIGRFVKEERDIIIERVLKHLNRDGILVITNPSKIWHKLNRFWRFIRAKMFSQMTFQDELCGWGKNRLNKVTYGDHFGVEELILGKPLKILERRKIALGMLDLLVAQKIPMRA